MIAAAGLSAATSASAQAYQYTNTTSDVINDVTCGTAGIVTRTFVVGTSYTVGDVDLGILLSHTFRADLRITLSSPAGTTINVMLNTAGSGDNLHDLFSDEATAAIASHNGTVTDPLTPAPPPYSHSFRPSAALSAFDGQNALGTWTMTICDSAGVDVGTFTRADLFITPPADLSLTKTVSNPNPSTGSTITYTLAVTNSAATATIANNVTVGDTLPAGVTFVSAAGTGTYTSGTGVWNIGTLAAGATATLNITATVTATSGTVTNIAQITASSLWDPDSTPNNGVTSEDDYASAAFAFVAILPGPVCSAGGTQQIISNGDFASGVGPTWPSWAAGAVWYGTGSATADNDSTAGTLTQSGLSGLKFGPSASNGAVIQLSQWWQNGIPTASSTSATMTVSLGGTTYAQMTTPAGAGTTATITYLNGASGNLTTIPALTTTGWRINIPTTVAASGALTFSFTPGGGTSDDSRVDNVTLYTCAPGSLIVAKTSAVVSDPINGTTLPKLMPGAVVRYCILTSNPGPATASAIVSTDNLPASVTYVAGSMTSAADCATLPGTAEDDDSTGADETDPWGGSLSGTTITGTATTLTTSQTFALRFEATIN